MKLGIDPKIDYAFKKLFGQERNKPLLVHLLNAVLQWPEDRRVVDLDILTRSTTRKRRTNGCRYSTSRRGTPPADRSTSKCR